ncbi:MAG: SIS domain-containing protein [Pedosphaera sp.]|nr:SIS domain-containing protein [Pedosphaera sp.]
MKHWVADYLNKQKQAYAALDPSDIVPLVDVLRRAHAADQQIFSMGNGGSAANASHFAVDLGKGASDKLDRRFRVLSLTDNTPWITALGNDYHYDEIFVRQLQNYARSGDVLIGISVSGNSPNCVKAFEWARSNGVITIGLLGAKRGRMADLSDHSVIVQDSHFGRTEDVQMTILHLLCYAFMEQPLAGARP